MFISIFMVVDVLDMVRSRRAYKIHNWDIDFGESDGYLDSLLLVKISEAVDKLAKLDYKDYLIDAGENLILQGKELYEPNVARVIIDTEFGRDLGDIDLTVKLQAMYKKDGAREEQDWVELLYNLADLVKA